MSCQYHKDRQSEYICSVCSHPICGDCMTEVQGKKVCRHCIEKNLFQGKRGVGDFSKFWSLVFSLVPGCGQMYMGLMNRGLQLLSAFVVIFAIGVMTEGVIISLSVIVWFYSFFDSLNTRKRLMRGDAVEDKIIYDIDLGTINHKYVGIGLIALGGISVFKNLLQFVANTLHRIFGNNFPTYWIYDINRNLVPIGLVVLGVYMLRRAKRIEKLQEDEME
ncbi:hypothetical protein HNQ80_004866 [Anaerosolibacter carboniphilus]|uniref:B box-type domain-containing protein n=1 Tax=Anaerosolibacter carboniphilus TaxID=1417629 RepID=A0A841L6H6_9FIRM|nr:B-box zinc finger protein [Anaerosolibacter carboniphilus]MBB6218692.1 hypothetical protein [Anaerosolibacter carboniphilus]